VLEEAALGNEEADVIVDGKDHEIPFDGFEEDSFHFDDDVGRVFPLGKVI
jgi:hypothetical protein